MGQAGHLGHGRLRRRLRRAGAVLAVALLGGLGHAGYLQATGNLHPVVAGELYRAGQPTAGSLTRFAATLGIRSVINLRGAAPGADWYDTEVETARELGLFHADFAVSDKRILDQHDAERLIALMRDAPKPLLIHCRAGSDRTGLAASLYLAAVAGAGEEAAEAQLSFRYGHVSIPVLSNAWPMDQSFELLEPWLGFTES